MVNKHNNYRLMKTKWKMNIKNVHEMIDNNVIPQFNV